MKSIKKYYQSWNAEILRKARACGIGKVLATVSGGPDSIALLSVLSDCRAFDTTALHCNFHLRGEESMRDQHSVEKTCESLGVKLMVKDFDIDAYRAIRKGCSVEMACRDLRYEWFREMASAINADRIATGHNADDNIETMLLNLLRGSGTAGLSGMSADNGEIWRPLLNIHRNEILDYLDHKGLTYVVDSSNLASDYRRNFLRNEVIPLLRTKWPGLDKSLDRSIRHIREDNAIVDQALEQRLKEATDKLDADTILSFPSPSLLVRRFIEPALPFTTTPDEILAAIRAKKPHTRIWRLHGGTIELRNSILYLKADAGI